MLSFLFDEDTDGKLRRAVRRHNSLHPDVAIPVVRVGEPAAPPSGTLDPEVLAWAAENELVLVTYDKTTMGGHLADFLAAGHQSPGVFIIRNGSTISALVEILAIIAHAGAAEDYADQVNWIP